MLKLFKKVPLRENYKETVDEYVRLKAPPNVSRACFMFELCVAATAFAISFYISFTSTTSVTSITYESLDSPYVCKVLSPRSDLLSFSAKSSEVAAFSSTRYGYEECLAELGEDGLDVCADGNRLDFVLSLNGLQTSDDRCFDVVLNDGYRFCTAQAPQQYSNGVEAFPTSPSPPSTKYDVNSHSGNLFYFANTSDTMRVFSAPFTTSTIQSGWVSYENSVFVVAESSSDRHNYIYEFAILDGSTDPHGLTEVTEHGKVELGSATLIGFSVANGVAYVWKAKSNTEGALTSYNLKTKASVVTIIDCTSLSDDSYSTPSTTGGASRMFYAADDGYLYAMCGTSEWNDAFTFYQIDAADPTVRSKLHVDIGSIPLESAGALQSNVTFVKGIYVSGGYAYFTTGDPSNNLIQVDLSPQPTAAPSTKPTTRPTGIPTYKPSPGPPSLGPTKQPTLHPTLKPTKQPTASPTPPVTASPTTQPTMQPTVQPTVLPTPQPSTAAPTADLTPPPTPQPSTAGPTADPTLQPTPQPISGTADPSTEPTLQPTAEPSTAAPTMDPTLQPTPEPSTASPSTNPTMQPTLRPTTRPTKDPTMQPTLQPSLQPVQAGSPPPTKTPTTMPTANPTNAAPPGPPPGGRRKLSEYTINGDSGALERSPERIDLADGGGPPVMPVQQEPWTLQPAVNLGRYRGSYMSQGFGNTIYFNTNTGKPTSAYYNITSGAFEVYDDLFEDYYRAVSIQIGYAFGICNEQIMNVTIDPTVSTDYKDKCGDINGIYYQKNAYFSVPQSCAGVFRADGSNINEQTISTCPGLLEIAKNFTTTDCKSSFETICEAAYTDNPPFSCTIEETPDFLTTLGSALSNASALWSLIAVLISVTLRRTYPGGVLARDFDTSGSKQYHQAGGNAAMVYPFAEVDEAGGGGGAEGLQMGNLGGPVTTQPGEVNAKPKAQQTEEKEEKEGFCEMFCDECTGC